MADDPAPVTPPSPPPQPPAAPPPPEPVVPPPAPPPVNTDLLGMEYRETTPTVTFERRNERK